MAASASATIGQRMAASDRLDVDHRADPLEVGYICRTCGHGTRSDEHDGVLHWINTGGDVFAVLEQYPAPVEPSA